MQTEDLQVILKVAEFRSISAAATSLDMHAATASAAVKRVEQALGVELFVRTTRQLRLSAAGEKYLPQCAQALQLLEQARQNIRADQNVIEGELRLAGLLRSGAQPHHPLAGCLHGTTSGPETAHQYR